MRRIEALKNGSEIVGNRTRAKVVKNKVAPPSGRRSSTSCTAREVSHFGELLDLGVKLELVQKSGSWFSIGETRIGQGRGRRQSGISRRTRRRRTSWRRTSAGTSTS